MARHYKQNPYEGLTEGDPSESEDTSMSPWGIMLLHYKPMAYKQYQLNSAKLFDALHNVYGSYDDAFYSQIHNVLDSIYFVEEQITPEYNGNSHFKHLYANYVVKISAGKNATISLISKAKHTNQPMVVNGKEVENCIMVDACGKTYILPNDVDLTKLHDLVTAYNFAYEKLMALPQSETEDSLEFELFCKCEKALLDMQSGKIKQPNFDLDKYITPSLQEKLNTLTEQDAFKKALVYNNIIPPESKDIKHPQNFNNFIKYVDKISPIYKREVKQNPEKPVTKRVVKVSVKITQKLEKNELDMQAPSDDFSSNI